jgi:mycofactocin system glycosyltransferase
MRLILDPGARIDGRRVIGGSPRTVLAVSESGARTLERLLAGDPPADSTLIDRMLDLGIVHPVPAPRVVVDADGSPLVTVVTPTLGEPRHRPNASDTMPVVLVDDGSEPAVDSATMRLEVNRGPAAARNTGLTLVMTPFVAFVDADVDVDDGVGDATAWIGSLLGHFDDDRVALVAPRVVAADRPGIIARHERRHGALDMSDRPAPITPNGRVSYAPAAAILCRTSAVRAVGGFDEDLRTGEDVDLVWRLHDAGWRVRYDPRVTVRHEPRRDVASFVRQRIGYGESAAALHRRHPGRLSPVASSPWSLTAWLIPTVWTRRLWAIPAAATVLATATARLRRSMPDLPADLATDTVWRGTAATGTALARAVRRVWWPLLVVAAIRSRVARRALLWSVIAAHSPGVVVDDAVHGIGVWRGVLRHRTLGPVLPRRVSGRPERRTTSYYRPMP